MTETPKPKATDEARKDIFPTTYWTRIIEQARSGNEAAAHDAWRELIDRYRAPVDTAVLARLKRWLHRLPPHQVQEEAVDVAADFFTYLHEQHILPRIDRARGFRPYVVGVLKRYLANYLESRAGGPELPDGGSLAEQESEADVQVLEEARWAEEFLRAALESAFEQNSRGTEILCLYYGVAHPMTGAREQLTRQEIGERFDMKPNAVDQANNRSRKLLGKLIEQQLLQTVGSEAAFQAERKIIMTRLLEARPGLFGPETDDECA